MTRAELYRTYAAECVQIAQIVAGPGHRAHLLEMAQRWRELAEKAAQSPEDE